MVTEEIIFGIKDFKISEGQIPIVCVCFGSDSTEEELTGTAVLSKAGIEFAKEPEGNKIIAAMLRDAADSYDKEDAEASRAPPTSEEARE